MMRMLFVGIVFALIAAIIVWVSWSLIIGAPWLPTPMKAVYGMLELADVHEGDTVIDLGSGDGRIIMTAAKDYKARAIGIEADPIRLLWSRYNIRRNGLSDRVKVLWGNFFDTNLGEATVVTLYQTQDTNDKLKPKLQRELKPGTRVVSHDFIFDGWVPRRVDKESKNFLYIV
jgi:predicted O-methyltransferase YrrM